MHLLLSAFLDEIWAKAGDILLKRRSKPTDTVNQRVYDIYNARRARSEKKSHIVAYSFMRAYEGVKERAPCWYEYNRFGSTEYRYRIYINAKPKYAPHIFLAIIEKWKRWEVNLTVRPPVPAARTGRPSPPAPAPPRREDEDTTIKPIFGMKIADEQEVRSGRADTIVVYVRDLKAGIHVVEALEAMFRGSRELPPLRDMCGTEVPRMTLPSSINGISYGAQSGGGVSFGETRCDLIARALAETVSVAPIPYGDSIDPQLFVSQIPRLMELFGNGLMRAEAKAQFVRATTALFTRARLDVNAPWEAAD